jgi:hypothetical protein
MKQTEVFKKIGVIISEITEQYEFLKATPDVMNDLELELFVANTHFLTEHAEILRKLNLQNLDSLPKDAEHKLSAPVSKAPQPVQIEEIPVKEKFFEPLVQQKPHTEIAKLPEAPAPAVSAAPVVAHVTDTPSPEIDLEREDSADSFSFIRQEPEMIRHELVLDERDNWEEDEEEEEALEEEPLHTEAHPVIANGFEKEKKDLTAEAEPEPAKPAFPVTAPPKPEIKDKEEEILTINQKISSQLAGNNNKVSSYLTDAQPITDLKSAITLNDKMLFVKDLFNGYSLAYSEAIEILNRFNGFEEAERFLKVNYVAKNNWEGKQATTDKFYSLLRRRFS